MATEDKAPYRVYFEGEQVEAEVFEASSTEEALTLAGILPEDWDHFVAEPLLDVMESECVCSTELQPFVNIKHPEYPGVWQCQNCQREFIEAPDAINWDNERMFAQGYYPCPQCDSYRPECPICHGSGWGGGLENEEDEGDEGEELTYWDRVDEEGRPYVCVDADYAFPRDDEYYEPEEVELDADE